MVNSEWLVVNSVVVVVNCCWVVRDKNISIYIFNEYTIDMMKLNNLFLLYF